MRPAAPILASAIFLNAVLAAQGGPSWTAFYNGPPGDQNDAAEAIGHDRFGNAYVTGFSLGITQPGLFTADVILLKYAPSGSLLWEARYDGGAQDQAHAILVSPDGDVLIAAEQDQFGSLGLDWLILRYDSDGTLLWSTVYDGPSSLDDAPADLAVDAQGNIYVTGKTGYNGGSSSTRATTIKLDPNGALLWDEHYIGPSVGDGGGVGVEVDSQDDILVAAYSSGQTSGTDFALLKYAPDGTQLWEARYDGPGGGFDLPVGLVLDGQDNAYVGGISDGTNGLGDFALVKYTPAGGQAWVARSGVASASSWPTDVARDAAGNILLAGAELSFTDSALAVQFAADGTVAWRRSFETAIDVTVMDAVADPAGGWFMSGYRWLPASDYDAFLTHFSPGGAHSWIHIYDSPTHDRELYTAVDADGGGSVWAAGDADRGATRLDLFTARFEVRPPLTLTQTPLQRGFPAVLTCKGADPFEEVHFAYSTRGVGSGPCPPQLGGLCLDLLNPVREAGSVQADNTGTARLTVVVPATAPLIDIHSQAVVARGPGSLKSNTETAAVLP